MVLTFPEQQSFLETKMPRRSRMSNGALNFKEKEPRVQPPDKKRLQIYQHYQDFREFNALEDFYWFYAEWDKINARFVKRFGRTVPELLIELQHMFRVKLENSDVLESTKRKEDNDGNENVWYMSLRDNWGKAEAPRGDPIIMKPPSPKVPMRIGRPDRDNPVIKYFDHPDAHLKKPMAKWGDFERFCSERVERLKIAEPHYPDFPALKVFGHRIRHRVPNPCSPMLMQEVVKKEPRGITLPAEQKTPSACYEGPAALLSPSNLQYVCKLGEESTQSVKLENLGSTVLFYTWERRPTEMRGVVTAKVTLGKHITNCRVFSVMNGSGSLMPGEIRDFVFKFRSDAPGIFSESWVLRVAPKLLHGLKPLPLKGFVVGVDNNRKLRQKLSKALVHREMIRGIDETFEAVLYKAVKTSHPTEEMRKNQYMFSSAAFNFIRNNLALEPPVYFVPSIYRKFQNLARLVREMVPQPPPTGLGSATFPRPAEGSEAAALSMATLEGMTEDDLASTVLEKLEAIESEEALSALPDVMSGDGLLATTMAELETSESEVPRDGVVAGIFAEAGNVEAAAAWVVLPGEVPWDGSVATILAGIDNIQDEEQQKILQEEIAILIESAQIPPHQTALLHVSMYRTLHDLTDSVAEVFENVTEESGRPLAERLMQNFYANFERERANKEEQEKLDAQSDRETGDRKVKDPAELLIAIEKESLEAVGLSPKGVGSSCSKTDDQEMLEYCLRWIHIMTELRCLMIHGFSNYEEQIHQEQAAVGELLEEKIEEYAKHKDEIACWNVFALERQKQVLMEEEQRLREDND